MKKIFILLTLIISQIYSQNFDVKSYDINLEIKPSTQTISGFTKVKITSEVPNLSVVELSLLQLNVDSVKEGNTTASYNYTNDTVSITLNTPLNVGDSTELSVYYNGTPKKDASFGGFYFSNGYAYNMGVGMSAVPHPFGRVWIPCVDTFTDRALFYFHITVDTPNVAVCNGVLDSITANGPQKTYHWHLNQTIPTYLANVAVYPYVEIKDTFVSSSGDSVPVKLFTPNNLVNNLLGSFVHLKDAFNIYDSVFTPYQWDRVGYVLVPFMAGAMEHATNISYPLITINGQTTYETIMAHELSHSWFGNLVTCQEAEEMWLNEGFASYCEAIFIEYLYGKNNYFSYVVDNHDKVLRRAHIEDGGYFPLKGVPQSKTYGSTTYLKGSDVIHTLRFYMGDSAFFKGIRYYLNKYKFSHVNSDSLQKALEIATGDSLGDFFMGWVKQAGFPAFVIDSFTTTQQGTDYNVKIFLKQLLKGTNLYRHSNRVFLKIYTITGNWIDTLVTFSGANGIDSLLLPEAPTFIIYDPDNFISDAKIAKYYEINQTGNYDFGKSRLKINVNSLQDTARVNALYYFTKASSFTGIPANVRYSTEHFWKIEGEIPANTTGTMAFHYDGTSGNTGLLDNILFQGFVDEDSLTLYYRKNEGEPWTELQNVQKPQANVNDLRGDAIIDTIMTGEFLLAAKGYAPTNVPKLKEKRIEAQIFPNPTEGILTIKTAEDLKNNTFELYDLTGAIIFKYVIDTTAEEYTIKLPEYLIPSMYIAVIKNPADKIIYRKKIMVK